MTSAAKTRAPLTSTEKSIITDLAKTLGQIESQFCCGGTIQLSSERKVSLLYKLGEDEQARSLDLPPTKASDVDKLLDTCVPSSHGRGKETVFDESYRLARELQQGSFALTADILNESSVLENIAALTSPRNTTGSLVARLYKLNSYGVGGFFKAHSDTPKSDRHIGTVVIGLPVPFKGGALRVSHEGRDVLFDWGETVSSAPERASFPWAFLFSDVEHEVLPVTSGTRITLAYDIFTSSETSKLSASPVMDYTSFPFYSDLEAALKNADFLPQGGKLGVALSHRYPVDSEGNSNSFASRLKGGDASLGRALSALGISVEMRAVYLPTDSRYEMMDRPNEYESTPEDGFGPLTEVTTTRFGSPELDWQLLFTSTTFTLLAVDYWAEYQPDLLKKYANACVEHEIIWARRPSQDAFSAVGHYIAYGNQADLGSVYVAAALVLNILPFGQGPRTPLEGNVDLASSKLDGSQGV